MHMADALISPLVGGTMWAATAGLAAYSARKVRVGLDEAKVPLMGVLAAFVFAAQMINFSIPGTGSSGHLGGGMVLAILLGPHAAFLSIASVLVVQALVFGDGGLLALGCNVFNLGFFPCFVAYPFVYRAIVGQEPNQRRILAGATLASVVGLQLGALGVVVETVASGISDLPFGTFLLLMQPVHLAIGLVEGLVTAAVVSFVWRARPEVLDSAAAAQPIGRASLRSVFVVLAVAAVISGAFLSWFASSDPDGLEWAVSRATGKEELVAPEGSVHGSLAQVQERTALLPDYGFREQEAADAQQGEDAEPGEAEQWPAVSAGTSLSGLVGGALTLVLAAALALVLRTRRGGVRAGA
jgi:cobalt/nickel transport system permease protein